VGKRTIYNENRENKDRNLFIKEGFNSTTYPQGRRGIFEQAGKSIITLKEASEWASQYLNRRVTTSNISYLIQYGKITKYGDNGNPLISVEELRNYYDSFDKEKHWKKILGKDLNWYLSFVEYKESERTKHVHRLHP